MVNFKYSLTLLAALSLPASIEANWFSKYNSRYDAKEACKKWKLNGLKYTYNVIESKNNSTLIFNGKKYSGSGMDRMYSEEYVDYLLRVAREKQLKVENTKSGITRYCRDERETRQFLGHENSCIKKKEYSVAEFQKIKEKKSCKNLKYFKY